MQYQDCVTIFSVVVILNCAGMACFHIAEDLETNDVTDNGDLKLAPYSMFFGSDMSAVCITGATLSTISIFNAKPLIESPYAM